MDDLRFDALSRILSSRRTATPRLLTVFVTWFGLSTPDDAAAHNPVAACRTIANARQRRACLRRARSHNRRHRCPRQPHVTFCNGRCTGTAINNCGERISCDRCPSGETCLPNGGCAQRCPAAPSQVGCPQGCACIADTEHRNTCVVGAVACSAVPKACATNADCPPRFVCRGTGCGPGKDDIVNRCWPLCRR